MLLPSTATLLHPSHSAIHTLATVNFSLSQAATLKAQNFPGEVVPGGGDWKVLRPDGDTHIYAKYALKTNDSVYINILNEGVGRTVPLEDKEQEEAEEKENGQVYDGNGPPTIRTTPVFEVDVHSTHAWLNDWIFVADVKAINSTLVDVIVYEVFDSVKH
ncbi:uncharacterized protein N7477_002082 [Penicillium maclennaniae]|uniref:uncharacterized protein n=1 Tax=Penicillium maclennaniae TaxID=1343394 RepID=UPI00253FB01A|nr:uncharacterized protein N7477_002082 [Penicillium maclennaniae]KAJ5682142.1 hypothetical protein N7477_002082 [Penicillium maclennaniae]